MRNGTIAEFEYNDGRGWPKSADGGGHSLVPLDRARGSAGRIVGHGGNWRARRRFTARQAPMTPRRKGHL